MKDGIGVKVVAFEEELKPNVKDMNEALSSLSEGETLAEIDPNLTIKYENNNSNPNDISINCTNASVGDIITVNGIEYLVVDNDTIITERNKGTDMGTLCTSHVTDMHNLFYNKTINGKIDKWDVSNVTNFEFFMDQSKGDLDQDLSHWDMHNARNINGFFAYIDHDYDISKWDVSNVTNFRALAYGNDKFNSDISGWDTSNGENMEYLMYKAKSFNQDLSKWNTSKVIKHGVFDYYASKWKTEYKPTFP